MSSNYVPPPKSQYEIERDERIARNEAFMRSLGLGGRLGAVVPPLRRPGPGADTDGSDTDLSAPAPAADDSDTDLST